MERNIKIAFNLLVTSFLFSCTTTEKINCDQTSSAVQKIAIAGFNNLYKVDEHLYRSEQPAPAGFIELQKYGLETILNVRNFKDDKRKIKGTDLVSIHLPMRAKVISYDDIKEALEIIVKTKKKVLIHCKYGSDRTGCVVAAYRMVINGWSKEQAITEFLDPRFGYHLGWFPNILKLLNTLDVEKLKKEIVLSK